jgi:hypothetical protein
VSSSKYYTVKRFLSSLDITGVVMFVRLCCAGHFTGMGEVGMHTDF